VINAKINLAQIIFNIAKILPLLAQIMFAETGQKKVLIVLIHFVQINSSVWIVDAEIIYVVQISLCAKIDAQIHMDVSMMMDLKALNV